MSERRYFSGDSEAQALMEAAIHFGLEPEALAFERVDKKHGFVRRRKRVMIEVDPSDPTGASRSPEAPAAAAAEAASEPSPKRDAVETEPEREAEPEPGRQPEPATEAPEAAAAAAAAAGAAVAEAASAEEAAEGGGEAEAVSPESPGAAAAASTPKQASQDEAEATEERAGEEETVLIGVDDVRLAVDRLLDLADLDVQPHVTGENGNFHVNVTGPEREWLLEEDASLLFSLEHLTLRMLWQSEGRFESLRVDSDGYRDEREKALRERAREEALRVRERGEATELEALDPAERRIVHLTVQDLEGVESHSRGRGFRKRVRIVPAG